MRYDKQCCRQLARFFLRDADIETPERVDSLAEKIRQNVQQAVEDWIHQMIAEGEI